MGIKPGGNCILIRRPLFRLHYGINNCNISVQTSPDVQTIYSNSFDPYTMLASEPEHALMSPGRSLFESSFWLLPTHSVRLQVDSLIRGNLIHNALPYKDTIYNV